ncbi:hypothetical protein DL95DRAFT_471566 [Leptodontidium sp. 2 PMI_412]|nr:hypothetical protein DL95DRAFT_471566 [Leptodontidium sp. 2 PMI_412]
MEFVEQLRWSPSRDNEVVEGGLAPHPHLPVMDGFQWQHWPIRFQLLESEAAYQHRLIHRSVASCMERFLVRIQSWSGEGPNWLVNESECGPASGAMKQSSSEHGKLEMDEQMDEQLDEQANRKVEDSSVYQAGIVDDFIDVDGCDWVLVELPDRRLLRYSNTKQDN